MQILDEYPEAPQNLSSESQALWNQLQEDWSFTDVQLILLQNCLESRDLYYEALAQVKKDGLVCVNEQSGAIRSHPSLTVVKDSRAGMLRALNSMHLDLEPIRTEPGRPPGRVYSVAD